MWNRSCLGGPDSRNHNLTCSIIFPLRSSWICPRCSPSVVIDEVCHSAPSTRHLPACRELSLSGVPCWPLERCRPRRVIDVVSSAGFVHCFLPAWRQVVLPRVCFLLNTSFCVCRYVAHGCRNDKERSAWSLVMKFDNNVRTISGNSSLSMKGVQVRGVMKFLNGCLVNFSNTAHEVTRLWVANECGSFKPHNPRDLLQCCII